MGEARYDVGLSRYGALGLVEAEHRVGGVSRREVEELLAELFDTMTPLDRAVVTVHRVDLGRSGGESPDVLPKPRRAGGGIG